MPYLIDSTLLLAFRKSSCCEVWSYKFANRLSCITFLRLFKLILR